MHFPHHHHADAAFFRFASRVVPADAATGPRRRCGKLIQEKRRGERHPSRPTARIKHWTLMDEGGMIGPLQGGWEGNRVHPEALHCISSLHKIYSRSFITCQICTSMHPSEFAADSAQFWAVHSFTCVSLPVLDFYYILQSTGARNRAGIGFSYRPARLHRLGIESWAP